MSKLTAFVLGMTEFRQTVTTHTPHPEVYDRGRDLAHRLTFRRYEPWSTKK